MGFWLKVCRIPFNILGKVEGVGSLRLELASPGKNPKKGSELDGLQAPVGSTHEMKGTKDQ